VARIRCTNPEYGHDYFRPFSCKGFYLCPSCSRKRTILFAEHLTNKVLLKLPHRQFVFTMPKALRPFFRHDRRLFTEVSGLIYDILREFYREAAGRQLLTGMVIAHQTFGDVLRWNPHFHAIVLEGGFDEEGTFFYIPFSGLQSMVEVFRRRVIKLLVQRELLNEDFARNLLSWKHSGFSIDNSVRILDESSQERLAEYIARPPISLKKIRPVIIPEAWRGASVRVRTLGGTRSAPGLTRPRRPSSRYVSRRWRRRWRTRVFGQDTPRRSGRAR
jgi:hypothetical protein